MNQRLLTLPNIQHDELIYLENLTADLSPQQVDLFLAIYASKRKTTETILICTLLGFVGFAGIHRFLLDQIAWGIIYFITAGFCFIGTIVDLINHKEMTFDFNRYQADLAMAMIRR